MNAIVTRDRALLAGPRARRRGVLWAVAVCAGVFGLAAHAQTYCPPGSSYNSSNYKSSCTTGTCWSQVPFQGSQSAQPIGFPGWFYSCSGTTPPAPPAGKTYLHNYDNQGNLTSVDGPLAGTGDTTSHLYDALNRMTRTTQPGAGQVNYGYNALDQLTSVSDPRSLVTSYTVNGLDNLTQQVSPDTGTATGTHDAAGNALVRTDAEGRTATHTYDALNRVTEIVHSKSGLSNVTLTYGYDAGANGKGRLTSMTDASGSSGWEYDAQGRVTRKTQTVTGAPGAFVVQYRYDSGGRMDQITYPSGRVVDMGFDALGRVSSITQNANAVLSGATYVPFGPVAGFTLNGQSVIRGHDTGGRLSTYTLPGETRVLGYDDALRITSNQRPDTSDLRTYSYDNLDRLTGYVASATTQGYGYDATGNRASATIGATGYTYSTPGTSNRLASVTASGYSRGFAYDATGNTTTVTGNQAYAATYDARGRLVQMTVGANTTTYLLNGLGQRVQKAGPFVPSGTNYFVYDEAGKLLGEYDNTGAVVQETLYLNDLPVATIKGTDSYFIYADHLNTARAIANGANQLVWRWDHDPFGINAAEENPSGLGTFEYNPRFPGQYFDKETNNHYNMMRDYDPAVGRYIQSDPIGLAGGLNTYGYVMNNPMSFTDPRGLDFPGTIGMINVAQNPYFPYRSEQHKCECQSQNRPLGTLTSPSGVNINNLALQATQLRSPAGWYQYYNLVKPGGDWDFKLRDPSLFEPYGNYAFGATCKAAGFPDWMCKRIPGMYQQNPCPEWGTPFLGAPPYGDDPRDQYWIQQGMDYYRLINF